jgi:hypothetical protein
MKRATLKEKRQAALRAAERKSQVPAEQVEATAPPHDPEPSSQQEEEQQLPPQQEQQTQDPSEQAIDLPPENEEEHERPPPPQSQPQLASSSPIAAPKNKGKGKFKSKRKDKDAIVLPETPADLEDAWVKLYIENVRLKSAVRDRDSLISRHNSTISSLSTDNKHLHSVSNQSTPRISDLESQLDSNQFQLSQAEEEATSITNRTITAAEQRMIAEHEATTLRHLNNTLVNNLAEARKKVTHLESLLDRMKTELDNMVEERIRSSVLEGENAKLRADVETGMETIKELVQTQQEMSIELNELDAEEEAERSVEDEGENLGQLGIGMRFRLGSIWEGGEAQPGPDESDDIKEEEVGEGEDQPDPDESEDVKEEETAETERSSRSSEMSLPPASPNKSPIWSSVAELDTAEKGTQTSAPHSPVLPPLLLVADSPPPPPATTTIATTSDLSKGKWTEKLVLILTVFLLALYTDRLAAEREIWASANDAVRELTAGWHGREWWSGLGWEWIKWEMDMRIRLERGMLG